ncbi:hypothetical protein Krac_6150 [Ktedonobacter racemifer DSM 44963]|uniref:Uncharacterized protein n=1 Tax=Ktedonobacter racemifer DSM 44963 TaxID=485913 RepID=D6TY21_KTERA|nr:hypothetical protein [Ktedonobacter racemifer]EFH85017.1 hypothetical protein Krac_6150 [Ktedonobacter racemifer DSM 44963]
MAKATKTIRQALQYPPQSAHSFAENQALYNRVVAFYFEVIQAHEGILSLKNKEALTALEKLTHATEKCIVFRLWLSQKYLRSKKQTSYEYRTCSLVLASKQ